MYYAIVYAAENDDIIATEWIRGVYEQHRKSRGKKNKQAN